LPIARIGAITSLACGAIFNRGFCQNAGKGQGEFSLLQRLWDVLHPGDVLQTDRLMANWTNILWLQQRGVEFVSRLNKANRKSDFRRGKRLGESAHLVRWFKPTSIRSLNRQTYKLLPEFIAVREARIRVAQPAFRTKSIVGVTTLLDPRQTTKEDLARLYRGLHYADRRHVRDRAPASRRGARVPGINIPSSRLALITNIVDGRQERTARNALPGSLATGPPLSGREPLHEIALATNNRERIAGFKIQEGEFFRNDLPFRKVLLTDDPLMLNEGNGGV